MTKGAKGNSKPVVKSGKKSFKQALTEFHTQQIKSIKKSNNAQNQKNNKNKNDKDKEKNKNKSKNKVEHDDDEDEEEGYDSHQQSHSKPQKKQQKQKQNQNQNQKSNNKNQQHNKSSSNATTTANTTMNANTTDSKGVGGGLFSSSTGKLSSLQQQFVKKLEGARFRTINEELYTSRGDVSFQEFQRDPSKFEVYHKGYREQASQWPSNPLDQIIDWIANNHKKAVIADMGCGDARLAATVPNKVHSFDLVAANPSVTACDVSHVPLPNESIDICVFCLSLMGINMFDFIREAQRILKVNGILKIAEVRSRFGDNKGILAFNKFLQRAGFEVKAHDKLSQNKMFFEVECTKVTNEGFIDDSIELKPCQYKKR